MGWLDNQGSRVQLWERAGIFFSSPLHPECLWGQPSFLSMGMRSSFPEVKWPGCEADHTLQFSAEVKE